MEYDLSKWVQPPQTGTLLAMFEWSSSEILTGYGTDWMTLASIKSGTLRNTGPSFIPDGTEVLHKVLWIQFYGVHTKS
jgi:hypothetical protein